MVKQASAHPTLASLVGEAHVRSGSADFAVDNILPDAIVSPGSNHEVAAVLDHANDAVLAVIPLGRRNHTSIGNIASRYDIALVLTRLDAVVEFEPADLTITCQAGIPLGRLREATAKSGLRVPFDPSLPDNATVGGVLAANLSGSSRMSLGGPRDFTIGMRVVTADGLITRAGGKVVKNVAGYDLCKLYIGSLGTLGVIVEATFKTIPLPVAQESLTITFPDPAPACAAANTAYNRGLAIESAVVSRHDNAWLLTTRLGGTPAAVERSARELRDIAGMPAESALPLSSDTPVVARLTMLPSRLPPLLAHLASQHPEAQLEAYPTLGVCRAFTDEADPQQLIATATSFGASVTFERIPSGAKAGVDVFSPAPSSLPLMRKIKREFDPNAILSPGRMAGRL